MSTYSTPLKPDELMHFGIKGMKWGVRRYQNTDGSYTAAGRKHYGLKERAWDYKVNSRKRSASEARTERDKVAKKYGEKSFYTKAMNKKVTNADDRVKRAESERKEAMSKPTLKEKWDAMDPKKKTAIKIGAGIAVGALAAYGGYKAYKYIKKDKANWKIVEGVRDVYEMADDQARSARVWEDALKNNPVYSKPGKHRDYAEFQLKGSIEGNKMYTKWANESAEKALSKLGTSHSSKVPKIDVPRVDVPRTEVPRVNPFIESSVKNAAINADKTTIKAAKKQAAKQAVKEGIEKAALKAKARKGTIKLQDAAQLYNLDPNNTMFKNLADVDKYTLELIKKNARALK